MYRAFMCDDEMWILLSLKILLEHLGVLSF